MAMVFQTGTLLTKEEVKLKTDINRAWTSAIKADRPAIAQILHELYRMVG